MALPQTTATFAINATVSNIVPLPGTNFQLVSVLVPSSWATGTVALYGSYDGVNTFPVLSIASGAAVVSPSISNGTGAIVAFRFDDMSGLPYIQFKSSVTQTAAQTLTLQFRAFQ